jgi:hypothetical protein
MPCPPQVPISIIPPVASGQGPLVWQNGNQITRLTKPLNPSWLVYDGSQTRWGDGSSQAPVLLPALQEVDANLIQYNIGTLANGQLAKTAGLPTTIANDLSGGAAGQLAIQIAPNSTSFIYPNNVDVTATGSTTPRTLANRFAETVNVLDYGADPTGNVDSTSAIQSAINKVQTIGQGAVYFPKGTYIANSSLSISSNNVFLIGECVSGTFLYTFKISGDFITFSGSTSTPISGLGVSDMTIIGGAQNQSSGALVKMTNCNNICFSNVNITDYFGCLHLESVTAALFSNTTLRSDNNFTSIMIGSYLLKVSKAIGGVVSSEIHFTNVDWRGERAAGSNFLDYGVILNCFDGVWFNGGHIGFCNSAAILIQPQDTTAQITALFTNNTYIDSIPNGRGVYIKEISGYTGEQGSHALGFSNIYNCNRGVEVDCFTTNPFTVSISQAYYINLDAVLILKGDNITVNLESAYQINIAGTGGSGIVIGGTGTGYNLNVSVEKTGVYTPAYGVYLSGTVDEVSITGRFKGTTSDIKNDSTGRNIRIGNVVTDKMMSSVAANGSGVLAIPLSQNAVFLNGPTNVTSIDSKSAWVGRTLSIISNASVSVIDGNNLKLTGNWVSSASSTLSLVCDGINWYEVSRSTN